jgi:hypothetical protein
MNIENELVSLCKQSLASIVVDPTVKIRGIEVSAFLAERFDSAEPKPYYIVSIHTNDASMVRGMARSFKGSYKERLEGVLDSHAKRHNPANSVHVEIRGLESNSVERLVPIADILRLGKLSKSSPIVLTAESNGISYIQIRGRHLIAPSPAVAEFLERYGSENAAGIRTAVDLFAGTAIATKVLCRVAKPSEVFVIDNDPVKLQNSRVHLRDDRVSFLQEDAMGYVFPQSTDLVVADPYYEDVERFLHLQLPNMKGRVANLLLVPGDVEDRLWNSRMAALVSDAGYSVKEHALYGQVILEAKAYRTPHRHSK